MFLTLAEGPSDLTRQGACRISAIEAGSRLIHDPPKLRRRSGFSIGWRGGCRNTADVRNLALCNNPCDR